MPEVCPQCGAALPAGSEDYCVSCGENLVALPCSGKEALPGRATTAPPSLWVLLGRISGVLTIGLGVFQLATLRSPVEGALSLCFGFVVLALCYDREWLGQSRKKP